MALVKLDAVSRTYPRDDGDVRALDGVALVIERGEFVAVTGPSGSGKSTLLHVLGLLDRPTEGRYELDGSDVSGLDDRARARVRNRRIGLVFQAFQLVPHLTVAENVELPLVYRGAAPRQRIRVVRSILERVGLTHRSSHLPDELSGGEQQRTAIARALVAEPDLLLADEPTGNLDEGATGGVLAVFGEIHRSGTTVVVVTHNARVAAHAERCYAMSAGRLGGAPSAGRGSEREGAP
jgi:putative ABC transport system ATP-binding protein